MNRDRRLEYLFRHRQKEPDSNKGDNLKKTKQIKESGGDVVGVTDSKQTLPR